MTTSKVCSNLAISLFRSTELFILISDRGFELELSWVTKDQPKHQRVPADIAKAAEDAAKAELADSDSEDDM